MVQKREIPYNSAGQLTLKALRPNCGSIPMFITLCIATVFFLVCGIAVLAPSVSIFEKVYRYDNTDAKTFEFEVEEDITSPLYILYQLTNFYQNHRRFAISRNYDQLLGGEVAQADLQWCDPRIRKGLEVKSILPCGIAAEIIFNDSFTLHKQTEMKTNEGEEEQQEEEIVDPTEIVLRKTDIVYASDKEQYINQEGSTQNISSDAFIMWMQPAALPYFRKTYGVIDAGLPKGKYQIRIVDQYNVTSGTKSVVITSRAWFGMKATGLGVLYIICGAIFAVITGIIAWIIFTGPDKKLPKSVTSDTGADQVEQQGIDKNGGSNSIQKEYQIHK
ncbi:MAG: putative cell cycle control protein [Streblomastix strix]|uniref:Putative cell cycle control protein n=1 Tax=Streblomastix strix TaxID=222440 RepID=A0A5J4W4D3_9EUKA|nr:MAG: putative cell cycle control protein [Streblomastix strix]